MTAKIDDVLLLSETLPSGYRRSFFSVPDIRCGGCVAKIEKSLGALDNVVSVRANQTLKRVRVDWHPGANIGNMLQALQKLGFEASVVSDTESNDDTLGKRYLRSTAVAGFAAGNIMMLSVAVWAGADKATQVLFHSLSAVLAVVAVVYSGSIFFESAWSAIRRGRTNMDVPISVDVILSMGLGLYETQQGGSDIYFEAATMLIFFLLVGRTLDYTMRQRAESSINSLTRIVPRTTLVLAGNEPARVDANTIQMDVGAVGVGQYLLIPSNTRVPLDSEIVSGESDFDTSIVNGEPLPRILGLGETLEAGVLNLGQPVVARVCNSHQHSFLMRTQRLVDSVSSKRGRYQTLSERVAGWYAPVVHSAALLAGSFWYINGADLHTAITIAIAVLIITCPCALGLAVPMVQVLAGGKLFNQGVIMKNGAALERLAEVDTVVFDKTGTLTQKTALVKSVTSSTALPLAALYSLAKQSSHPFAQSIAQMISRNALLSDQPLGSPSLEEIDFSWIRECPGKGIEGECNGVLYRLGKMSRIADSDTLNSVSDAYSESGFSVDGEVLTSFRFEESLRDDAQLAVNSLKVDGCFLCVASGDETGAVEAIASALGINTVLANAAPDQKSTLIQTLQHDGNSVLMIGDGINDTVAQVAADVSFAMGDAGDIAATNADFVLMQNRLTSISVARRLAVAAKKLVQQNIAIAITYNIIAMPLAFAGWVSPLVAAIAMSASSLLVLGNSLRLNGQSMRVDDSRGLIKNGRSGIASTIPLGEI